MEIHFLLQRFDFISRGSPLDWSLGSPLCRIYKIKRRLGSWAAATS